MVNFFIEFRQKNPENRSKSKKYSGFEQKKSEMMKKIKNALNQRKV